MFTIKYRYYEEGFESPTAEQIAEFEKQANLAGQDAKLPVPEFPRGKSRGFAQNEMIDGPYESVSTRYEGHDLTVYCRRNELHPGMTYGPIGETENNFPRPTLWVMNAQGATIAKYDL